METIFQPLISIIIPTYNSEKTILKGVSSILEQTYNNWEIVIVDNLSEDGTIEKIQQLNIPSNQIKIISEKDKGIYDAMNKGIYHSSGEWLYFMGSDDWLFDANVFDAIFKHQNWSPGIIAGNIIFREQTSGEPPKPELFFTGYAHQASFFHRSIFNKYLYTTKYKVFGDQYLFMQVYADPAYCFEYIPLTVAYYSLGGFSGEHIDVNFANDAAKNISNFFPSLKGKLKYLPLRKRAFDTIKAGKWHLGLYWLLRSGEMKNYWKDALYCFKVRWKNL